MRRIDCQAVAMQARGNRARLASSLAAAVAAFLLLAGGVRADQPVGITAEQPWLDVMHEGRLVRIRRESDNLNQIDPDFAMTSRPCPPYCVQPMHLAPGVETIGELELLEYLRRITRRDDRVPGGRFARCRLAAALRHHSRRDPFAVDAPASGAGGCRVDRRNPDPAVRRPVAPACCGTSRMPGRWCSTATGHGAASRRPTSGSCWRWATRRTSSSGIAAACRCGRASA
jgi:hypothetical protein